MQKWNFELYVNGECEKCEKLTVEQIQKISDFIQKIKGE